MPRPTFAALVCCLGVTGAVQTQSPGQPPPLPPPPVPVVHAPAEPAAPVFLAPAPAAPPQEMIAGHLMLGQMLGARLQAPVYNNGTSSFVLEGFYGLLLHKLASGEGVLVGGRYLIRRYGDEGNALTLGPGLGVSYNFSSDNDENEATMLVPSIDLSYLRGFKNGGGWETGVQVGAGVRLSGDHHEAVTPLFSFYTGLRF